MYAELPHKAGFYERYFGKGQDCFALSIPDSYQVNQSFPLILVLHWGGPEQPHRGEAILSGLALPAFSSLGAIMVAPDCPDQSWITQRSENYLLELLDALSLAYTIAPQHYLITGYSMGAIGTWYMAAHHQNFFGAALPISATPPAGMMETDWHIPVYVIHSTDDEIFPFKSTQQVVEKLQQREVDIHLSTVKEITHFDVSGFVKPVKAAVPWIHRVWSESDHLDKHRA